MDEDDNKQDPAITDMVFDESLPLRPPPKPGGDKPMYSPNLDPDTIDLFGDAHTGVDDAVADELRHSADEVIENLVNEYSTEIANRLREELSSQLAAILEDLKPQ